VAGAEGSNEAKIRQGAASQAAARSFASLLVLRRIQNAGAGVAEPAELVDEPK
jgi:hypothetical protein